jgi:hypothetical protein
LAYLRTISFHQSDLGESVHGCVTVKPEKSLEDKSSYSNAASIRLVILPPEMVSLKAEFARVKVPLPSVEAVEIDIQ